MNKNYEKIKAACIKANPKLMELSLGSQIRNVYRDSDNPYQITTYMYSKGKRISCLAFDGRILSPEKFEILGHEPSFTDIILAIGNHKHFFNHLITLTCKYWDLTKNNLKDQSEETLQFLADLL